ncbi:M48 family metalloprotease [Natronorubrum halophilum]|uniref:M48 family metalloprotease n=1 Tax=Natronorubrum halophilum TaxID=1702106 RepID=UPI001EE8D491|nr:M48 family metalloprotease [Natronorubrum halophilum]
MSAPDTPQTLRLRMLVALGLIVCLPFAFVYTFVFLANTIGIALLEWANERPYHGEFYVDPLVLTVVVLGGLVVQYYFGPRTVLGSVGARAVDASEYPELHATVTRLSTQVDVAKPDVAIVRGGVPNAFAVAGGGTGRIVVTSELLETLEDEELEAVVAHELAHLKNRDANLMTVAWLLPTLTYYLAIVAFYVLYGLYRLFGSGFGGGSSRGDNDGRGLVVAIVVIVVCAVVTLTVSAMFWAASVLFYRVLSRQREYAADRAAAAITGSPAALAGALEKIDESMPDVPDADLRKLDGGAEALYLAPLESRAFGSKELVSTDIFPDTHPPTQERIERLRDLAAETGTVTETRR